MNGHVFYGSQCINCSFITLEVVSLPRFDEFGTICTIFQYSVYVLLTCVCVLSWPRVSLSLTVFTSENCGFRRRSINAKIHGLREFCEFMVFVLISVTV